MIALVPDRSPFFQSLSDVSQPMPEYIKRCAPSASLHYFFLSPTPFLSSTVLIFNVILHQARHSALSLLRINDFERRCFSIDLPFAIADTGRVKYDMASIQRGK